MSFWTDLVDAAVLGTGRAAPPPPPPSVADLAKDDPGLLRLAAVASRARRACYSPAASGLEAPGQAPPDHRPGVSVAATQRLAELLADEQEELVAEWLRLLAGVDRRPPEARLPDLLWGAAQSERIRAALTPVLGPVATWLAAQNPAWDWAVTAGQAGQASQASQASQAAQPDLDRWTTASHRTRREMLDQLRRADPGAGRELVAATWPGDSPRDRAAFVAVLAVGLSADDEPLLVRALADGRGEVRQAAADLLAKLPGSAFSGRAAARAAAAVQVRKALVVTPPAEATREMIADCFDARPPRGTGLASWLLRQVVATAPAAWWTEHTGLPPARLLAMAAPTPWAAELEAGWTESAMRDAHVQWLTALLDQARRQADEMATALLKALPAAERDSWMAAHPDSPLFAAIELVPAPWSARLSAVASHRIVATIAAEAARGQAHSAHQARPTDQTTLRRLLRVAAVRLEPPVAPDVDPAQVPQWLADGWAKMVSTLSVRAAMRRELVQEATR